MEAALAAPRTETHDTDAHLATRTVVAANELTRRYGTGRQPSTRFAVSRSRRPPDRSHGPVGLGQVDTHAHPRRPRQAVERHGRDRRRRHHRPQGQRPHEAPPPPHRLRLPVLQPAADAVGRGEHHPAAVDRGHTARARVARGAAHGDRPREPPLAPAGRALRRPAAARRRRARARLAPDGALRRRAHRQPRLPDVGRDPRAHPWGGRHATARPR